MEDKKVALENLKAEMERDLGLPLTGEANLVFGEGDVDAAVMFIGEAPGFHEDKLGRPFVGRAGKLLDELLKSVGWPREGVYITNIVKRRPPENRDPTPEEIESYKPYLTRQIELLNPKMIVTLGRFSMNYFLPLAKISRDRGTPAWVNSQLIVPVYHPAAALRSTAVLGELKNDFHKLPEILRNPPSRDGTDGAVPKLETQKVEQKSLF
ncbi:MAG: uracil-DNA glycosylase [Patescibacteria group bacterium]